MRNFYNSANDIEWLFDVHVKGVKPPVWVKSFVLFGNEDCPTKVELFDKAEPLNDSPSFTIYWQ